jgi:ribonuclease VapC
MVVDSSAIVAILFGEPEAPRFKLAIAEAVGPAITAVGVVEVGMVALSRRGFSVDETAQRLNEMGVAIVPVGAATARLALDAFARFGRGRHPAGLNLGDCFSYALARERGEPLLFKGEDFARTDVAAA